MPALTTEQAFATNRVIIFIFVTRRQTMKHALIRNKAFSLSYTGLKLFFQLASMLFILAVIVFYVARLTPGDPLQSFYGDAVQSMTQEQLDAARDRLGLNEPVYVQFSKWIEYACQGNFGISLRYKRPVLDVVAPLLGNTLILGVISYILVFTLAIGLALICARYENKRIDKFICKIGTIAYYTPAFWLGVVLILIFSINLQWLPAGGAYDYGKSKDWLNWAKHLVLPVTIMVTSHFWYYAYMIRNKLLDETRKDYVLLARAKGMSKMSVLVRHCLRNVMPAIINIMAVSVPHIISGTYVAETVFNYPGIGLMAVSSAKYHDYNLLMIIVLITGFLVVVSSFTAQFINEHIDPRIKGAEIITL